MDLSRFHKRTRQRGVPKLFYWSTRAWVVPLLRAIWRVRRVGAQHIPTDGPTIFVANHRSFIDPFIIATLTRRPMYFVAKRELFRGPISGHLFSALGAFPVDRGSSDQEMIQTARAVLERGDCVMMFPEGTRQRSGPLGAPKRGFGRLALETGAAVVPVAIIGTERGFKKPPFWPGAAKLRVGKAHRYPRYSDPSPELAESIRARVWACVELQWEWLGGEASPPPPVPANDYVGQLNYQEGSG